MESKIRRNNKTKLEHPNQLVFPEIFEAGDVPIPDQLITISTARRLGLFGSESGRSVSKKREVA